MRLPRSLPWLPLTGLLGIPLYNSQAPEIFGFSFLDWCLFAWVPLASFLTWLIHGDERREV